MNINTAVFNALSQTDAGKSFIAELTPKPLMEYQTSGGLWLPLKGHSDKVVNSRTGKVATFKRATPVSYDRLGKLSAKPQQAFHPATGRIMQNLSKPRVNTESNEELAFRKFNWKRKTKKMGDKVLEIGKKASRINDAVNNALDIE